MKFWKQTEWIVWRPKSSAFLVMLPLLLIFLWLPFHLCYCYWYYCYYFCYYLFLMAMSLSGLWEAEFFCRGRNCVCLPLIAVVKPRVQVIFNSCLWFFKWNVCSWHLCTQHNLDKTSRKDLFVICWNTFIFSKSLDIKFQAISGKVLGA